MIAGRNTESIRKDPVHFFGVHVLTLCGLGGGGAVGFL